MGRRVRPLVDGEKSMARLEWREGVNVGRSTETRYRRLFETAHDGILILDASTGRILDANPFMTNLLGLSHNELLGKELWQVGLLLDAGRSSVTSGVLREPGFIRHESCS
jgi:PAS domain-containing protein